MNIGKIEVLKSIPSDRIVIMDGVIDDKFSKHAKKVMFSCDARNNDPILFYISSGGGDIAYAFSLIGFMKILKSPIYTYVSGVAFSAAAILLMSGEKGHRYADECSTIMAHYSSITIENISEIYDNMISDLKIVDINIENFVTSATGKKLARVRKDLNNETMFTARKALKYGIVDHVC